MPGMDGKQLATADLRAPAGCIRVLFMSGYTADVIAQRGVLEQNTNFIPKPFTRLELATKVHVLTC
jgi:two-component system, cell cycle sensor histidine kinase and response regulator CckA